VEIGGMLRLSASSVRHLAIALAHESEQGRRNVYYDDVIGKALHGLPQAAAPVLRSRFEIDVLDLAGAPWMEIDDLNDMAHAGAMFETNREHSP
jgi:hypothetical protein